MAEELIDAPADAGNPNDQATPETPEVEGGEEPQKETGKTLAEGGGTADEVSRAPADWPEDWRDKLSAGDKDAAKLMGRYKSPVDVAKALREAQKKISEGAKRPTLSEDASDEEVAAYRKELGIPEKPEGYLESLPQGLVIGEDDKEMADSFISAAHKANMPPEAVGLALDWYYKTQEDQAANMAKAVNEFRSAGEDALRAEWGAEYRANQNAAKNLIQSMPETEDGTPLWEIVAGARLENGAMLGDSPDFLRWMVKMANDANPAGFVAPGSGTNQAAAVDDEIAEIEKVMREDNPRYIKDEKMQARLRQLYDAQEKLAQRA